MLRPNRLPGCSLPFLVPVSGALRMPLMHPAPMIGRGTVSFSENHFKNWLFLSFACRKFSRMAAELRPYGRQTTPPGRAGEVPHANTGKQHNFFRGLRGKKDGRAPCPPSGLGRMGEGGRGTKRPGLGLLCAGRMQEGIVPYTEVTIKAIYLWIKGLR